MKISTQLLQEQWQNIPQHPDAFRRWSTEHPLDIYLGYGLQNNLQVLIHIPGPITQLPASTRLVELSVVSQGQNRYLSLQLQDAAYQEIFLLFCKDIVQHSATAANPVADILQRYKSWQKLLQKGGSGILSQEEQKGLIGELLYLQHLLNTMTSSAAIQSWRGPDKADQDFVFASGWSEVKAVKPGADKVGISSLQQLALPEEGKLIVFFLDVTDHLYAPVTLCALIDDISQSLQSDTSVLDDFNIKLMQYGYDNKQRAHYEGTSYRVLDKAVFKVNKDFPRLTPDNVPSAVTVCSYSLALTALQSFKYEENLL